MTAFKTRDTVHHARFGRGHVEFAKESTALVRFSHGIEECLLGELELIRSPGEAYLSGIADSAPDLVLKLQAEAIRSINDAWGVFSPNRIDLYPHQLWVCKKVTEQWPLRWVIADDVGLGKTIEAGLILWRIFHLKLVRRMLVLCPASLVNQWQKRMLDMFDIRMAAYVSQQDSERTDFWKLNDHVVASFQTLRDDRNGRHERMLNADGWDIILVDEAHHLNHDEQTGMTLGHRLVRKLDESQLVKSILLFTGTPHRGKHFGFLALMALVRPDLFDPRRPVNPQMPNLHQALIRNNKYCVTDLDGKPLFHEPEVTAATYAYSDSETRFYSMMTEFIDSGRAYANSLSANRGQAVKLVLVALQKLASSSIDAVRSALKKRLVKLRGIESKVRGQMQARIDAASDAEDGDRQNQLIEDEIATMALELMVNECARLTELIQAADEVHSETKITAIIEHVRSLPAGESVLFFTEYKATQSLLLSSLLRGFGPECATFINGDEALPAVKVSENREIQIRETRDSAAERFNNGEVRFLVSTEAGGEGIDLQDHCSRLIHVDLPWNPMRMHQRVGRLNRIGQKGVVKVMLFQNPATVEARIWTLLNEKLKNITMSINQVTETPEDLTQLVLGVSGGNVWEKVFSEGSSVKEESLASWFDSQTGRLEGKEIVHAVQDLIGHAQRFDYGQASRLVPKADLPDLEPFFKFALRVNRRQIVETDGRLSFRTPDSWSAESGVRHRYDDVHFLRKAKEPNRGTVLGVGSKLFDCALTHAVDFKGVFSRTRLSEPASTLCVFRIFDRVTGNQTAPAASIASILIGVKDATFMDDVSTLRLLNALPLVRKASVAQGNSNSSGANLDPGLVERACGIMQSHLGDLPLPFRKPDIELLGIVASEIAADEQEHLQSSLNE